MYPLGDPHKQDSVVGTLKQHQVVVAHCKVVRKSLLEVESLHLQLNVGSLGSSGLLFGELFLEVEG